MHDPTPRELARIQAERARIFTPGWFADLRSGRLGFGDTFWLGNYGILLGVVPVVVLVSGLFYAQAPGGLMPFLRIVAGLFALWRAGILRALLRARGRGGWVLAGLVWTACEAAAALWYAFTAA